MLQDFLQKYREWADLFFNAKGATTANVPTQKHMFDLFPERECHCGALSVYLCNNTMAPCVATYESAPPKKFNGKANFAQCWISPTAQKPFGTREFSAKKMQIYSVPLNHCFIVGNIFTFLNV
jgi:hypothetical protein